MATSEELFAQATGLIPGGVNSPVRAFRAVGGSPFFVTRGSGARLWAIDGDSYLDYVGSWGPLILGHAHPKVVAAVQTAAEAGTSYGAPTPGEVEMARLLVDALPSLEMVRLVSSGTEAVMSALRLARGVTGRQKIVKFEGGYHGHADSLLVKAGSGGLTFSLPDSLGVPETLAQLTLTVPYNDLEAVRHVMASEGAEVAAIIVEPVAGNMGVVPPEPGFLAGLRKSATAHGTLLIFDEVITGFRVGWSGAQAKYGVTPDLTCLGKIIGGGLPVGAYGGRREIMAKVAPLGGVYQAGTLSGNPLAIAAGLATLELLQEPGTYDRLERLGQTLEAGLITAAREAGIPVRVNRVGSMLTAFFTGSEVADLASAKAADTQRYAAFFHGMLAKGIFFAPSQFEAAFCSLAHTEADLEFTIEAAQEVLSSLR